MRFALLRAPTLALVMVMAFGLCGVVGCAGSSASKQPEQMKLDLSIIAKASVNPDDKGRPAPVLVRLYELKNEATFVNADYFLLDKSDTTALAQDLLIRDEFILRPGETRHVERELHKEAHALGFLVGFRDLGKAQWRAVHVLPPAPKTAWYRAVVPAREVELQVILDQQTISITKEN